ncbi:MAG: hypothetical protein HZB76_04005 [Chlamydiae bacterium]|nr:hypothetical protein [Chlamydiota bacterium]
MASSAGLTVIKEACASVVNFINPNNWSPTAQRIGLIALGVFAVAALVFSLYVNPLYTIIGLVVVIAQSKMNPENWNSLIRNIIYIALGFIAINVLLSAAAAGSFFLMGLSVVVLTGVVCLALDEHLSKRSPTELVEVAATKDASTSTENS